MLHHPGTSGHFMAARRMIAGPTTIRIRATGGLLLSQRVAGPQATDAQNQIIVSRCIVATLSLECDRLVSFYTSQQAVSSNFKRTVLIYFNSRTVNDASRQRPGVSTP